MLKRLTIQNYALISSLDISFPDGLVIITGETGAGKSILLGAISLLLGNKADSSVFNDPDKNCVVEAEFGDDTILRRVVSPSGRSRSFLNDEPLSLTQLSEISNKIIDIHEQHQHLLLTDPDFQLLVLDYFAGNGELLKEYVSVFDAHKGKEEELKALDKMIEQSSADADYRQFQFKQLDEARLKDGEMEELEAEQKMLSNAEEIKSSLFEATSLLNPYDTSLTQNLKEAGNILAKCSKYIDSAAELANRMSACRIELSDIEQEISKTAEDIVVSPQRLQEVDDRLSLLYSLLKKHHCTAIAELIQIKESLDNTLYEQGALQQRRVQLQTEADELDKKRKKLSSELSARRSKASAPLAAKLQESICSLEMPHAVFKVDLLPKEKLTPTGADDIAFMFSANGSAKLGNISKVASGGELSRVMLCLKALMAEYTSLPTMIFDEIDTGVSGRIADRMGDMIGSMGKNMQIFAITHLPQIASKKGAHYLVYKEFDKEKGAQTKIRLLSYEERVQELARMLSGSSLSDAAVENAKVLLKENDY